MFWVLPADAALATIRHVGLDVIIDTFYRLIYSFLCF